MVDGTPVGRVSRRPGSCWSEVCGVLVEDVADRDWLVAVGAESAEVDAYAGLVAVVAPLLAQVSGVALGALVDGHGAPVRGGGGVEGGSLPGSVGCGGQLDDLLGWGEVEAGEQVAVGFGQLGALPVGAGGAGEGADVQLVELVADVVPGQTCGGLGDAEQEQGQPAQDDVGADALFEAVVDRSQLQGGLEGAPAAFNLEQLLVAQGDVLGGKARVGGAEQVLAVQLGFPLDRGGVDAQQPAGRDAQVAVEAGLGGDDPTQLGPLGRVEGVGVVDHVGQPGEQPLADVCVAVGGLGVVADDEPFVVAEVDFLDAQVAGHDLVAALPGQGGGGLGGFAA